MLTIPALKVTVQTKPYWPKEETIWPCNKCICKVVNTNIMTRRFIITRNTIATVFKQQQQKLLLECI